MCQAWTGMNCSGRKFEKLQCLLLTNKWRLNRLIFYHLIYTWTVKDALLPDFLETFPSKPGLTLQYNGCQHPTAPIISPQHSMHSVQLRNQKWRVKQKVLEPASLRCLQGSRNSNSCQPDLLIGIGRSSSLLLSIQVSQLPPSFSYHLSLVSHASHSSLGLHNKLHCDHIQKLLLPKTRNIYLKLRLLCVWFFFPLWGRLHLCLICGYL